MRSPRPHSEAVTDTDTEEGVQRSTKGGLGGATADFAWHSTGRVALAGGGGAVREGWAQGEGAGGGALLAQTALVMETEAEVWRASVQLGEARFRVLVVPKAHNCWGSVLCRVQEQWTHAPAYGHTTHRQRALLSTAPPKTALPPPTADMKLRQPGPPHGSPSRPGSGRAAGDPAASSTLPPQIEHAFSFLSSTTPTSTTRRELDWPIVRRRPGPAPLHALLLAMPRA
ncbi:uncharacterized protein BDZ99DRAFT_513534 [Mytilinidion resinicola]|uniref:Uncharacterized protein n=1 Tax=Mytilinidion resinicola TaxID=574789 RepID=A0A6A6Z851_9PEZI|nr:uncharacterized protein BDZ99DRAFT_513534 [Mytilinidion resinicola]KAF2817292.1 hypothetical protein BDZ99DRAFT_513534 [Mytilinidion resinicola]